MTFHIGCLHAKKNMHLLYVKYFYVTQPTLVLLCSLEQMLVLVPHIQALPSELGDVKEELECTGDYSRLSSYPLLHSASPLRRSDSPAFRSSDSPVDEDEYESLYSFTLTDDIYSSHEAAENDATAVDQPTRDEDMPVWTSGTEFILDFVF